MYLGAAPVGFLGHADALHEKGIVGVINMCGEYRGPVEDYRRLGIEQLWLPTVVRKRGRTTFSSFLAGTSIAAAMRFLRVGLGHCA